MIFDALGEPRRRKILLMLGYGPRKLSQLQEPLGITLAAVVQHTKILEECSLISTEKRGRERSCYLNQTGFDVAQSWIEERKLSLVGKLNRLGTILESLED